MLQVLKFQIFQGGFRRWSMRQNLEMIKGDTLAFCVEIEFDESPQQLSNAYFSCKNIPDGEILFQKSLNDGIEHVNQIDNKLYYRVRIAPQDTKKLEIGRYHYDVEIRINSDVFTILNGILKIEKEITE